MTELVRPFAALRPTAASAAEVVAPPYDVVSTEEARALAAGRPRSFLHISRPEIDLPEGDYTTVAGLVLDRLGHLPDHPGESVEVDGRIIEVVELDGRVISLVRIRPASQDPARD